MLYLVLYEYYFLRLNFTWTLWILDQIQMKVSYCKQSYSDSGHCPTNSSFNPEMVNTIIIKFQGSFNSAKSAHYEILTLSTSTVIIPMEKGVQEGSSQLLFTGRWCEMRRLETAENWLRAVEKQLHICYYKMDKWCRYEKKRNSSPYEQHEMSVLKL